MRGGEHSRWDLEEIGNLFTNLREKYYFIRRVFKVFNLTLYYFYEKKYYNNNYFYKKI